MMIAAIGVIEGFGYYADEGLADVISQEVAEVKD
jgi:hypothetical protein